MHDRFPTYVNTLQSGTNESEIIMKPVQSSYVIVQASHPPHRIVRNSDMAVFCTGDVRIVIHRLNNLIRAAAITTSFATDAQSCLNSPQTPLNCPLSVRTTPKPSSSLAVCDTDSSSLPFAALVHRQFSRRFDKPLSVNCCHCIQCKALMIRIGSQQHSSCLTPVNFKEPCSWIVSGTTSYEYFRVGCKA